MAQTSEGTSASVEAVRFGFITDEEVRKSSFVKITNPTLLDSVEMPMPSGLYDPAMGPLDDHTYCKSCGQRAFHCPGHCGHIDLTSPAYNPLLFDMLYNILQKTCLFCRHFKAGRSQVERCASQLKLIMKGDVIGAKRLDSTLGECAHPEDSGGSNVSCSTVSTEYQDLEHLKQQKWTSLQLTEAISVLSNLLKPKFKECKNCGSKNPRISKPTFGWFHMNGMLGAHVRANIIRGSTQEGSLLGGSEDKGKRASSEYKKQKDVFSGPLLPSEVRDIVKLLWENEAPLCSFISDIQQHQFYKFENTTGYSMFFLETILVPPIKFRPPSKGGDSVMEHPHTVLLGKVLQSNISLLNAHVNKMERQKIVSRWIDLQQSINMLFDSKKATGQGQREIASGICQLLEKKEGVFRQKMMGKRVNFACRSVISPDPYLAVNEIGIPPYFALRLTYPERVTPWNVDKLRDAIINGSEIHPGATHYVDRSSTTLLRPDRRARMSVARKLQSSRGVVTQLGKSCDYEFEGKAVYRHLRDGDIVLVNRQPTLHKPSIMAHVVRVLKGEKTLRMHYANCSTYNADFDGDEMNVHFPQDEISRSEAYNIVNANNQYIVPTRGEPSRGLIQDHIVSAVLLTKKDSFLSRDQYNQLLYSSGVSTSGPVPFSRKPGKKVCIVSSEDEMQLLLPAILKPKPLWTGKQVITALLNHITRGCPPFTVEKEGKISARYFVADKNNEKKKQAPGKEIDKKSGGKKNQAPGEETLYIFRNDLVRGVIDKAQFGSYGLVHVVYELYGSSTAGSLLSALSRLFTVFLQMHGFTCGVDDLLLSEPRDVKRKKELEGCEKIAEKVHCEFISGEESAEIEPMKLQLELEKAIRNNGESAITRLDGMMRQKLGELTTNVNKDLFLNGILKPFPENCFSLMTTTGAKGGPVNFQQVSSLLGQQELEGKRVPRMVSGKTLPCFHPWDCTARGGGYIIDNFLTGLRPQEYYFHCMAGREGLVDTAVKTSRSGYLQRCLVKNLESLKVSYDHTVRDTDGSIIQFIYGGDGLDVHQTSFIGKFESLEENRKNFHKGKDQQHDQFNRYIEELPFEHKKKASEFITRFLEDRREMETPQMSRGLISEKDFMKLVKHQYFSSLAQPGEPVGVIAAQSVGEPSTQMTLNTFHLAGRGEMNVTLGIPRLQEILMTASIDIKTPFMSCPLQQPKELQKEPSKEYAFAKSLAAKLKKVTIADLIESLDVSVVPFFVKDHQVSSIYKLKMKLYESKVHPPDNKISLKHSEKILTSTYLRELEDAIQNHFVLLSRISGIKNFMIDSPPKSLNDTDEEVSGSRAGLGGKTDDDDDDDDDIDEEGDDDLGLDTQKRKQQTSDEREYEDGSEDEQEDLQPHGDSEKEIERTEDDSEISQDNETAQDNTEDETAISKPKSGDKKRKRVRGVFSKKDTDRAIYVDVKKTKFEVHFRFTNEPHIMLAQIAEKAAKKVYVKNSGKIDQCQVIDCSQPQVLYDENIDHQEKKNIPALLTAGLDFQTFWQMQGDLAVNYVYSNNIHAMLSTYGVEAARKTIIREIVSVFGIYGVNVDMHHLSLIADFMTHSGGYRPMSRSGGIAESTSPFNKMSFETASKFITEAVYHGLTDDLESPSARICLGLPVKLGTGCFDLMQKVEI